VNTSPHQQKTIIKNTTLRDSQLCLTKILRNFVNFNPYVVFTKSHTIILNVGLPCPFSKQELFVRISQEVLWISPEDFFTIATYFAFLSLYVHSKSLLNWVHLFETPASWFALCNTGRVIRTLVITKLLSSLISANARRRIFLPFK